MKAHWLVLGLLGALFSGASADPAPLEVSVAEAARADECASGPSGHRAAGPHFYVWQEEPEEAASWAAVLGPLDSPRPRK